MNSAAHAAPAFCAASPDSPWPAVSRFRMWLALSGLAAVALLCATPFLLPVLRQMLAGHPVPMSLGIVVLLQDMEVFLFTAALVAAGVWAAPRVGLDAPLVRARLAGQPVFARLGGLLPLSVALGTLGAFAVLALDQTVRGRLPADLGAFPAMPWWASASGAFYGGIVEELLCRWGLLSLLAFVVTRLGLGQTAGFWVANVASALAFGALHLPPALQLGLRPTPLLVGYVLAGNAVVGLLCGWLFRRRGLESAMLAHGSADLWLHVVFPALGL